MSEIFAVLFEIITVYISDGVFNGKTLRRPFGLVSDFKLKEKVDG